MVRTLSLVCAGVLLVLFVLTLPWFLRSPAGEEHAPARWSVADDHGDPGGRRRGSRVHLRLVRRRR